eukprot:GHVN01088590.1.p1 GENE.GHVN01088590.1~~GHVN01088590.1.p1  ORF type:complete len:246 (-),score=12.92 GHVN01088590.1:118-855(-)
MTGSVAIAQLGRLKSPHPGSAAPRSQRGGSQKHRIVEPYGGVRPFDVGLLERAFAVQAIEAIIGVDKHGPLSPSPLQACLSARGMRLPCHTLYLRPAEGHHTLTWPPHLSILEPCWRLVPSMNRSCSEARLLKPYRAREDGENRGRRNPSIDMPHCTAGLLGRGITEALAVGFMLDEELLKVHGICASWRPPAASCQPSRHDSLSQPPQGMRGWTDRAGDAWRLGACPCITDLVLPCSSVNVSPG